MARLLWLADVLRAAGLIVHEYPEWKSRGSSSFGPVIGIIAHHTGSSLRAKPVDDLRQLAITGTPSAPEVPISQLYLARTAEWWVIASGTATGVKTGWGGALKGYGDDSVLQIEAQHSGKDDEPWTPLQYRSYVRGVAALRAKLGIDVRFVVGHKEHQPGSKFDPTFDMSQFRRDVADPTQLIGGRDVMLERCKIGDTGQAVFDLQTALVERGGNLSDVGGIDKNYGKGTARELAKFTGDDGTVFDVKQLLKLVNAGNTGSGPGVHMHPHTHSFDPAAGTSGPETPTA